jgi:ketopantoate reductase
MTKNKDDLEQVIKHVRIRQPGYRIALLAIGQQLRIGPLQLMNGKETAQAVRGREVRAQYLTELLFDTPFLGANEVPEALMSFLCFKKLVSTAVLGPIAVMRQCTNGELFSDPSGREIGQALIFEAWSVIRRYLPYIKLDQVSGWIVEAIAERRDHLHPMLLEALTGKETDIDDINGWIIDQAHQYGIPCDHHEGIRDLAKARTEEIKREMEAIEAVKRAGKQPSTR